MFLHCDDQLGTIVVIPWPQSRPTGSLLSAFWGLINLRRRSEREGGKKSSTIQKGNCWMRKKEKTQRRRSAESTRAAWRRGFGFQSIKGKSPGCTGSGDWQKQPRKGICEERNKH